MGFLVPSGIAALVLLTGSSIGLIMAGIGLVIFYYTLGGNISAIGNGVWNIFHNLGLAAVPIFFLLAEIIVHCGLATRIYQSLSPLFERLPGKLLQTNIGMCTIFSAISGSSTATAAMIGSMAYDELTAQGYRRSAIIGSIGGAGTLGVLIPPSILLIIYGSMMEVSVGALFVAGVVPGLMMATLFMLYVGLTANRNVPATSAERELLPLREALKRSLGAWPFIMLVFVVLGTIFLGLATATESAAMGVVAALVLAALYRELTWKRLVTAVCAATSMFSMITLIIFGAVVLGQALALSGIPKQVLLSIIGADLPVPLIIAALYLLYLLMGCVMSGLEMMLITLPLVFPLMTGFGYDPVWLGVAIVIIIEIAMLTPPFGVNLFILISITKGGVTIGEAAKACIPYWMLHLTGLIIITIFPEIVMFLPRLFLG